MAANINWTFFMLQGLLEHSYNLHKPYFLTEDIEAEKS